ncbi:MAG: Gfo/Idh/MocA family oxidoreductase [Candidatus Nanopelagicales bacterium]|nr:Gfo/Idh/MocA family oxidoreductase [Candidatus Nanopelagicales bacterium]
MTQIRVGLIGYGLAGRLFHAPFITANPDLALTTIVTRDPTRAHAAASEVPGAAIVADVDAMLTADVELVVVASPSALHEQHARLALEAGRHVVLDKPAARDAREFEALVALAGQRERELVVFHNRRWDSEYLTLRAVLAEGVLGTVHRFESRMERWRPVGKGGWRESADPADMGGLRYDLGPHLVDQALQLFGPVESVSAHSESLREVGSFDDDVQAMLVHRGGVLTVLSASLVTAIPGPRMKLLGSDGAALLDATDGQEDRLRAGERPGPGWGAELGVTASIAVGDPARTHQVAYKDGQWPAFYAGVADCLLGRAPTPVTNESALAVMEVLGAIGESARTHRSVVMKGT